MFFSSVLVPSSLAAGGAERDVGVAAQRALLHVHVADAELAQRRAQQPQPLPGLLGRAQVRLGDDLDQRRAAAVEVDDARVASRGCARSRRRGSAWRRPPRGARGGCAPRRGARRGTAARRTGRSDSPWAGRDRSSSCGGRSSAARARSRAPARSSARSGRRARWRRAALPGSPRQTGQVRVFGRLAEGQLAAAEHLRRGRQLDVDLEADDRLVALATALQAQTRAGPASKRDRRARARGRRRAGVLAERGPSELQPAPGSPVARGPHGDRDRRDAGQRHRHRAVVVEVHRERVGQSSRRARNATVGAVGVTIKSTRSKARAKSSAIFVRTRCARP